MISPKHFWICGVPSNFVKTDNTYNLEEGVYTKKIKTTVNNIYIHFPAVETEKIEKEHYVIYYDPIVSNYERLVFELHHQMQFVATHFSYILTTIDNRDIIVKYIGNNNFEIKTEF